MKVIPNTHKNESGLIQLIMMGESIRQIWINKPNMTHGMCHEKTKLPDFCLYNLKIETHLK